MLKRALKLNRDYKAAKQQVAEQAVNAFESKISSLYFILFLASVISAWLITIFLPEFFERLYQGFGFSLLTIFFVISYFSIFLGSKFIFKPTAEELADDTSLFAIFSACERKERRSLISIGFAFMHTLIFVLYILIEEL